MKVLHVYKFYSPVRGGGISAMENIIQGLDSTVDSSVLVATEKGRGGCEHYAGANVRRVYSFGYWKSMPIAPTLPFWFMVDSRKADIVHIHLPFPIADIALALWSPKIPVVLHWHSDIIQQETTKRWLSPILRNSLRRADRIIVGSPNHVPYSRDLGPYADKCEVIPYGIEVQAWSCPGVDVLAHAAVLRARFPNMIFFLGRLVAYKGVDVLLRAMREVDAPLVIAGDGPLRERFVRVCGDLGIGGRVYFTGELSPEDLKAYYHAAVMLVLPSIWRNEAFGLAQIEAMACSKPVINTGLNSGVPWVARNEKEALTVPPGDAHALAAAISRLLENRPAARRLGEAGLARVRAVFNRTQNRQQLYAVYQDILRGRTER